MRTILALAAAACAACSTPSRTARVAPAGTPELRVMTYNLNYGLGDDPVTRRAIAAHDADIVLLQETTERWEQQIRGDFSAKYPHMTFFHCCLAGGLGVLSKRPIKTADYLEKQDWFPALVVVVESPVGDVQILNVHLRPAVSESGSVVSGYFSTPKIRRAEITAFADRLQSDLPTLVVGDFNEDEDGGAIGILETRGFTTVLPEFDPGASTWRWNTSIGEVTTTLDHICYDRQRLEPLDAKVLNAGRSDHLPVVATFMLTQAE